MAERDEEQSPPSDRPAMLPAALYYGRKGLAVFPLEARGKRPLIDEGVAGATMDATIIRAWWTRWPDSNIGVATGAPSGFDVLDIDGPEAETLLQELERELGRIPATYESRTARGRHRWFFAEERMRTSASALGQSLNTLASGAYVVAPPSVHPSGQVYEWAPGHGFRDLEAAAAWPEWMIERVASARATSPLLDETPPPGDEDAPDAPRQRRKRTKGAKREASATSASAPASVVQLLACGPRGPNKSLGNCTLILQHDPRWQGVIAYDEREGRVTWLSPPPIAELEAQGPYPRALIDADETWIAKWLERVYGVDFSIEKVHQALCAIAHLNAFDRVRDYLSELSWDGVDRIDTWLRDFLGVEDNDLTRAIGRKWLISAVARALAPGCQVDHVLVLEGAQGAGKSSALRALAREPEWFCDRLPDLRDQKAAAEVLQGPWIVEIGELDALSKAEVATIKSFLTARHDRYRAAYDRNVRDRARRTVFAASTNEQAYLRDPSGGRRFWPVRVDPHRIDVAGIVAARDQLWAEAVVRFRAGEPWHLETKALVDSAREAQAERFAEDAWEGHLEEYLHELRVKLIGTPRVTVEECLARIGRERKDWTDRDTKRVVAILTTRLGWIRVRRRDGAGGARKWAYEPPPPPPTPVPTGVPTAVTDPGDGGNKGQSEQGAPAPVPTAHMTDGDTDGDRKVPVISGMSPPSPPSPPNREEQTEKLSSGGPGHANARERDMRARARGELGTPRSAVGTPHETIDESRPHAVPTAGDTDDWPPDDEAPVSRPEDEFKDPDW